MILQSLVRCYDSLAAQGTLKRPGWSAVKVQWGLRLTPTGRCRRWKCSAQQTIRASCFPA